MFKKLMIAAFIATAAFAQKPTLLGGYRDVEPEGLVQMQNDANFAKAEKTARDAFGAENNGELGQLLSVSQQVVSGVNYKMVFQTENGEYEVVVYTQPWTDTYKVLTMKPVINKN